MPPSAPPPRRIRLGTRELVIAFAIVEAVALLWLVTRVPTRGSRRRAAAVAPVSHDTATLRPSAP